VRGRYPRPAIAAACCSGRVVAQRLSSWTPRSALADIQQQALPSSANAAPLPCDNLSTCSTQHGHRTARVGGYLFGDLPHKICVRGSVHQLRKQTALLSSVCGSLTSRRAGEPPTPFAAEPTRRSVMTQQPQPHTRVPAQHHQQLSPPPSHDVAVLYSSTGSHCCFNVLRTLRSQISPFRICGWSGQNPR